MDGKGRFLDNIFVERLHSTHVILTPNEVYMTKIGPEKMAA